MNNFIDQLIDWQKFEEFVKAIYAADSELIVERNVTENGKSGAARQIDVKVTQKTKLHTYVTIIECKRWKEKVGRDRIDVLAASVDDLNANKGVMFTTTGYEPGALDYAKAKNIDVFLVRDLTDEEWGLPGRHINFYLQIWCAKFIQFVPQKVLFLPFGNIKNPNLAISIQVAKDQERKEEYYLYSVAGEKGPHLVDLLLTARQAAISKVVEKADEIPLKKTSLEQSWCRSMEVVYDFSASKFCHLRHPFGIVTLTTVNSTLLINVSQTCIQTDRGETVDFALTIENYITRQRNIVSQPKASGKVDITDQLQHSEKPDDALENGSVLRVFTQAWVDFPTPQGPIPSIGNIKFNAN